MYLNCIARCFLQGVGTVVSGTTLQGVVRLNDVLFLGPDSTGSFQSLPVKSIHRKRMPVREVRAGQTASFALKKVIYRYLHSVEIVYVIFNRISSLKTRLPLVFAMPGDS